MVSEQPTHDDETLFNALSRIFPESHYPMLREDDFNEALRQDPGLTDAWVNRGDVRLAQGRPSEALDDYAEALALEPDLADAYRGQAEAYAALGNTEAEQEARTRYEGLESKA